MTRNTLKTLEVFFPKKKCTGLCNLLKKMYFKKAFYDFTSTQHDLNTPHLLAYNIINA